MTTNLYLPLPAPAGNGPGAAVDMTAFGSVKTITVANLAGALVSVEISNDDAALDWTPVGTRFQNVGEQTIEVACHWMRANVSNYSGGGAPVVEVGGTDAGTLFAELDVPTGNGTGANTDTSTLGLFKTVQVGGDFGGLLSVEVSEDGGVTFGTAFSFSAGGQQTKVIAASDMRVKRTGATGGTPIVNVAAVVVDAGGGSGSVPTPPFALAVHIIYARTTGSDTEGNGLTPATAYRTMQRAVRDVPQILPPGAQYFVDITGIDETLPDDYTLPAWKAPFSRDFGSNGPYNRYFLSGTAVSIVAVPQPVASLGAAGIIAQADGAFTFDPITGLARFTFGVARPSLAGVVGKRVIVSSTDNPVGNNLIHAVGPGGAYIDLCCAASFAPQPTDFPLTIMEPSASVHGSGFSIGGALNSMNIDSMGFKGLKIFSDIGAFGLYADGLGVTVLELCDLDTLHVFTVCPGPVFGPFNRLFCNWITTFTEFGGATLLVQSLMTDLGQFGESILQSPNKPILVQNVFRNIDQAIEVTSFGPGTGVFFPSTVDDFQFQHNLIDGVTGGADGVIFHGNRGNIVGIDVTNCGGNGIVMKDGAGVSQLNNCGSSGGITGFGLVIDDGMQVKADVATTTTLPAALLALAGTAGEISLGSVGPVLWATVAAPPNNVADYVGVSATGSRISQS